MPSVGQMWFFVNKEMKISDFKKMCQNEDTLIKSVEVNCADRNSVTDESNIYELLSSRQPLFLSLNGIQY
jgi:hypothetical protein